MFRSLHFELCTDAAYEDGYEKIAIYAQGNVPKHVARQLPDGIWTSKLGSDEDIYHNTLDVLEGGDYGDVVQLMKRKV